MTITRRNFLRGAAAIPVAAPAVCDAPDPLADLIRAYREEEAFLRSFPGDIPDDFEHAAFGALEDELPPAQSREVAVNALRLSVELSEGGAPGYASTSLSRAALAFFETNA